MAWWGWLSVGWLVGAVTGVPLALGLAWAWTQIAPLFIAMRVLSDRPIEPFPPSDPRRPTPEQEDERSPRL